MMLHPLGRFFTPVALAGLVCAACSADHEPPLESGQTGSIAPGQCQLDSDCDVFVEQTIAELAAPAEGTSRFDGAACIDVTVVDQGMERTGSACDCKLAGEAGSSLGIGPAFLAGCSARGRLGECLAPASQFPGCEPAAQSEACLSACGALEAALAQDAQRTFDVGVRLSRCVLDTARTQPAYECRQILEIDGGCYTTTLPNRMQRYDCALSDEQILGAAAQSP